jgi:V/A-type H+-transporting ATPase subunit I
MLVPMARVTIVGLRPDLEAVLAAVHRLGVLEVTPLAPPRPLEMPTFQPASPDRARIAAIQAVIDRLGVLLELVPPAGPPPPALVTRAATAPTTVLVDEATALLATVEPTAQRLTSRQSALEAELAALRRYQYVVERLLPLAEALVQLEDFETIALVIQPTYAFVVDTLRQEVAALTHRQSELVTAEAPDGSIAALLVVRRQYAAAVHALLRGEQLEEVRLPEAYYGRPLREALQEILRRQEEIPRELAAVREELAALLGPHQAQMAVWRTALLDRLDELMAVSQCLESDYTFALGGWVPVRDLPRLEAALTQEFDGRVAIERVPVTRADWARMPVLVENPRLVRPFEVLLRLLPAPRYGTIDPTPFVALFFPLFFGMILGDIGYGALLLALGLWAQRHWAERPWLRQAAQVLTLSALAAIVFGFAFGECFGDLGRAFGLRPLVADRAHAVQPLLLFSVALGGVHVALGLVLGVINGLLERQGKEALSKIGTLFGLIAVFALVGVTVDFLPRGLLTPGVALLTLGCALLVYSVGFLGPLEILGVLGNTLSYMRLVAVGLASVILAQIANDLAGRTGSLLLGAIVGALFHGLNLALGLFSPSVHSLRLQYVEFFGRFFQPGGRPFAPFRCRLGSAEARFAPATSNDFVA